MLSPAFPDLLVLKNIRRCLETMSQNKEFMQAINMYGQEDEEQDDREVRMQELHRIQEDE